MISHVGGEEGVMWSVMCGGGHVVGHVCGGHVVSHVGVVWSFICVWGGHVVSHVWGCDESCCWLLVMRLAVISHAIGCV